MSKLQNKGAAIAITTVIVVLSVCFGAVRSVRKEANRVQAMFVSGTDGSGYGISGDLDEQMEYAGQMVKVAQKYTGMESETDAVRTAVQNMAADKQPADLYQDARTLQDAMTALNLVMEEAELSETDENYRVKIMASYESPGYKIAKEAVKYNAEVATYQNEVYGGLIGSLVDHVIPLPVVEAYE